MYVQNVSVCEMFSSPAKLVYVLLPTCIMQDFGRGEHSGLSNVSLNVAVDIFTVLMTSWRGDVGSSCIKQSVGWNGD